MATSEQDTGSDLDMVDIAVRTEITRDKFVVSFVEATCDILRLLPPDWTVGRLLTAMRKYEDEISP